uniref:Uncharacterized protein n=1 Tax=Octopus bimaculoides TaxID=37653 RepID=A0A0L8HND4_OCTBM
MQKEALLLITVHSVHPPNGSTSEDRIFFPALNVCSLLTSVPFIVCPVYKSVSLLLSSIGCICGISYVSVSDYFFVHNCQCIHCICVYIQVYTHNCWFTCTKIMVFLIYTYLVVPVSTYTDLCCSIDRINWNPPRRNRRSANNIIT